MPRKTRKTTTPDELMSLHARYMEGESPSVLESEAGYGRGGLLQAFRNADLPRGRPRVGQDDPRAEHALRLWDEGAGLRGAAEQSGLPWRALERILVATGRQRTRPAAVAAASDRRRVQADDPRAVRAIELWDSGMSLFAVSELSGLAKPTVRRLLHDAGRDPAARSSAVRRRRRDAKVSLDELEALHARYANGDAPIKEMSVEAGYGVQGLAQAFLRHGLPLNPRGPRPLRPNDPKVQDAIALWDSGVGMKEIAARGGIGPKAMSRLLREVGRDPDDRRSGPGHPMWKGGRWTDANGYVRVRVDPDDEMAVMRNGNGEVFEHRLVMARALGRPLTSDEEVHHIDEPKTDNRLENLQLRRGKHGKGHAFECADCGSHNIVAVEID